MSHPQTKQTRWVKVYDATGSGTTTQAIDIDKTQRTLRYKLANLMDMVQPLRDFTNGVFIAFECSNQTEAAGVAKIYGYADKGGAELVGVVGFTSTVDATVSEDGNYWANAITETTENQTMATVQGDNQKAMVKIDTVGYKELYIAITGKTTGQSTIGVWVRTW
jgi:hypothetical protein